jgi:hypothetical protein
MEKFLVYYEMATKILSKIILGFSALAIGLAVASITTEAATRYLWGSSQAFMEELPRLLVPFIVFPMMGRSAEGRETYLGRPSAAEAEREKPFGSADHCLRGDPHHGPAIFNCRHFGCFLL